ncbi:PREDICTED: cyclin-A2 [Cyphomyrmex costatus]|uniref:G2/mitotic-specific cyclin-A n=1 Tax=Cyphomyrmex costatus TaxID=456900 RepID=A0A195BZU4_9HYME|nr:PREDICTED: cyclin-A2 [Cyphomyrmex costatus]KYM93446.1 G2/mitotic-specific cyclin-A [Cyphomyrmex costatus]
MAAIRIHEDQENRITGDLRGRGKESLAAAAVNTQTQVLHQAKRAVLGVLHNNCPRNGTKPEICKDEKYIKAKAFIPMQSESFKIYEEGFYKKEEPTFKIYEDKLEEETSVALRNSKENKEVKEATAKCDKVQPRLEIQTIDSTSTYVFYNKIEEVQQNKNDDILSKDSPMSLGMSLEKSLTYSSSSNEEYRLRRECNKELRINIFDVDEYRADIYNYLRTSESLHRPKPGYMKKQPDITYSMRSILIDWLVEVAEEYRLQDETLYLAISYIDRFLSYMSVVRSKLQLVGTAAMFIAAKYEEIYPPDVGEFVYITDDTYTKTQVIKMENLILKVLSFDLTVPTYVTFLMEYCISNNLSDKIKCLAMYLCELSMLEGDPYLQYLPSHLAASALALARHTLHEEIWPHELELSTGYNLKTLKECIAYLSRTFSNAPNFQQTAIQEKYRSSKYGHVSMLLPRSTEAVSFEDEDEEENA